MTEKLILCAGGELYRVDSTGWVRYCLEWMNGHQIESQGRERPVTSITPGHIVYFGWLATGKRVFSTPRVLRSVGYNSKSGLSFEEALYNAEWIQGYEYRIRTRGQVLSINAANPFKKGTPEQKWWEAGYWAAIKEAKEMQCNLCSRRTGHADACPRAGEKIPPVVELPDAKVEILLKLNAKVAQLERNIRENFRFMGEAIYNGGSGEAHKFVIRGDKEDLRLCLDAIKAVQSLA